MSIKVSIILPCYNISSYLERCVNSIQNQTFINYEVIFVNDGSTDNIEAHFEELNLESNFKLITKKNEGAGVARNYGLEIAQGEYVYFMDPDDEIEKDLLKDNINMLEKTNANFSIFGYREVDSETNKSKDFNIKNITHYVTSEQVQNNLPRVAKGTSLFAVWNKVYRKSFLCNNSLSFSSLPVGQDAEFNLSVFDKTNNMVTLTNIYYIYYASRHGSTRTKYNGNQFESEVIVLKKMIQTSQRWDKNDIYIKMINKYKLNIIIGEVMNLKKIQPLSLNKLLKSKIYSESKQIKYSQVDSLKMKIKLLIIKTDVLALINKYISGKTSYL